MKGPSLLYLLYRVCLFSVERLIEKWPERSVFCLALVVCYSSECSGSFGDDGNFTLSYRVSFLSSLSWTVPERISC